MPTLRFGAGQCLEVEFDGDTQVTVCDVPHGDRIADLPAAIRAALVEPCEFPPLWQAATPGDNVVLALPHGVPEAKWLVAGLVAELTRAGVSPSDITILATRKSVSPEDDPRGELPAEIRDQVALRIHDPRDREAMSYLAATADATPVYLNRCLQEADLVVGIGVVRPARGLGYYGTASNLFPTFSDAATQARFRAPAAAQASGQRRLQTQADEAGWLLGSRFTVQVVPGAGDDVLAVFAGDLKAASRAARTAYEAAWKCNVPARTSIVVAAIGGAESEQTWENVGRAIATAARLVEENGDIIICSELNEPLGMGLDLLIGADSLPIALREIEREEPADSLAATQVGEALQRGRLYLVSELTSGRIEDLGIHAIDADDVARVAGRYDSCILLSNAQFAEVSVAGEADRKARRRRSRS